MNENTAKLGKLRKEIESCSEKEAADIVEAAQKAADEAISAAEKEARSAGKHSSRRTLDNSGRMNAEEYRKSVFPKADVCFYTAHSLQMSCFHVLKLK